MRRERAGTRGATAWALGGRMLRTMSARVFDNPDGMDEAPYLAWTQSEPGGFVVNTERSRSPGYVVLHRAACGKINATTGSAAPGGFTSRQYIKACAPSVAELRAWVEHRFGAGAGFSKRCGLCSPTD